MENYIIDILREATFPVTTAQLWNAYAKIEDDKKPKSSKKEINALMYKLKGTKIQMYDQFSPPSWSIIGAAFNNKI